VNITTNGDTNFYTSNNCRNFTMVQGMLNNAGSDSLLFYIGNKYLWLPAAAVGPTQFISSDLINWMKYTPNPPEVGNQLSQFWSEAGDYVWVNNADINLNNYGLYYASPNDDVVNFQVLLQLGPTFSLDIIYFAGKLVLSDGDGILTSKDDGLTWQRELTLNQSTYNYPFNIYGQYLIVGHYNLGYIDYYYSTDGENWLDLQFMTGTTPTWPPNSCQQDTIYMEQFYAYGAGIWIVWQLYEYTYCCDPPFCEAENQINIPQVWMSNDISQQFTMLPNTSFLYQPLSVNSSITAGGNEKVLIVIFESTVYSTSNGTWSSTPLIGNPPAIFDSSEGLSYVGNYWIYCISLCYISPDGANWEQIYTGVENQSFGLEIRYSPDTEMYYAYGADSMYAYSPDCFQWSLGNHLPVPYVISAIVGTTKGTLAIDNVSGSLWSQPS